MGKQKRHRVKMETQSSIRKILQESARAISCIYELTHVEPMDECTVRNLSEDFRRALVRFNQEKRFSDRLRKFSLVYFAEEPCPRNRPF
jgi:hypothetical protein